jgi:hypothetical protein
MTIWKTTEPEEQKRTWILHYPKCNEAVEADLRAPTTRGHVPDPGFDIPGPI